MSLTVQRSTRAEGNFIRFCQEVARYYGTTTPFWLKNLDSFEKIFIKFRENGKCFLPVLAFITRYRDTLELPVILNSDPNDKWLLFDESLEVPKSDSWTPVKPRGVYLTMKDDVWTHCLPLSEVYRTCLDIADSQLKSFSGVSVDSVPAKFLALFYRMLLEVEPENLVFKENAETCEELLTSVSAMPDLSKTFASVLESDGARQIQQIVSGFVESIDDSVKRDTMESFTKFTQSGDLSGLMTSFAPLLQNPGLQSLFAGLMPQAAPSSGQEVAEEEVVDPEEQE